MIPFITNFKQNSQILMKENLKIILCDACNISMRDKRSSDFRGRNLNVTRILLPCFTKVTDPCENSRGNNCSSVSKDVQIEVSCTDWF